MKLPLTYFLSSLFILSPIVDAEGKYYPDADWEKSSPESQGIELKKIKKIMDLSFSDSSTQGVVVIKNGIIIGEKYAEGYTLNSHGTSWSMAKSYYAALVGISIQRGEIGSLDDPASKYLEYYKDERSKITIRDLLNMSSGLDFPSHEHEKMFFQKSHLDYAKNVGVEKEAGLKFEYNNVNSMIIGDILYVVTGIKADKLLVERILDPIGASNYKLWKDEMGAVLTYCCVDMTPRDYSKIGLLFARNGNWEGSQIIPEGFINETFQTVWETPSRFSDYKRYYSLHWWVSKYDDESKIFNTSGKFGQYTFVDRDNDVVVTRITKYSEKDNGDIQKWGPLNFFRWAGVGPAVTAARLLLDLGLIREGPDVNTPITDDSGTSKEFYEKYQEVVDAIADLSRD
ncbi:beta-lactamase family protein [Gammaproteobacteria bacterium]|nr:beta-lactamase family protein [Gammaproteobacteria bacterium]MDA7829922.1 beta-lactamase family protein [Gammaproteobacteria bacterium]MDA7844759.1 beta-lactamase family protein [Gammaproteobacteria bacterium]MDA9102132.1 beta-lactamase family protein [Gammaproteobacteria bacterium]|tara:strand:- start:1099 stop:2295 length:1197 start_codon:yes stop_codon:yes gene_type:complete